MYEHESLVEIEWNAVVTLSDVLEGVQQHIMSVLIVTELLLLLCNVDCDFDCLFDIADGSV